MKQAADRLRAQQQAEFEASLPRVAPLTAYGNTGVYSNFSQGRLSLYSHLAQFGQANANTLSSQMMASNQVAME